MNGAIVVQGTLEADGTLHLDQKPTLAPGRVRVTVEPLATESQAGRFWNMMNHIWADLRASGRTPRSREQIDAEIDDLRQEADDRMQRIVGGCG